MRGGEDREGGWQSAQRAQTGGKQVREGGGGSCGLDTWLDVELCPCEESEKGREGETEERG